MRQAELWQGYRPVETIIASPFSVSGFNTCIFIGILLAVYSSTRA
jgi:hypothetical protein